MIWAQFWDFDTGYIAGTIPPQFGARRPVEACGSDGVAVLDGRHALTELRRQARKIAEDRGYIGFALHRGASFTRSHKIHPLTQRRFESILPPAEPEKDMEE